MKKLIILVMILVLFVNLTYGLSPPSPECPDDIEEQLRSKVLKQLPSFKESISDICQMIGTEYVLYLNGVVTSNLGNDYNFQISLNTDEKLSYTKYPEFMSIDNMKNLINFIENQSIYAQRILDIENPRRNIGNSHVGFEPSVSGVNLLELSHLYFIISGNDLLVFDKFVDEWNEKEAIEILDISDLNKLRGCIDPDGGANYYEKGTAYYNSIKLTDYCEGDKLIEAVCVSVDAPSLELGDTPFHCSNGCKDGACILGEEPPEERECPQLGYRRLGKYCNVSYEWEHQREGGEFCDNNFECKSNSCLDSQCTEPGLWIKFFNWLAKLFG